MAVASTGRPLKIAMAGTLPPWKGISPYCAALAGALAASDAATVLTFLDFEQLYPAALYPGSAMTTSATAQLPANLLHRRELHYGRPDEAFKLGRALDADILHVQFWSEFLAPTLSLLIDGFHAGATADRPRRVVLTMHNLAPHEGGATQPLLKRIAQSWKDPFGLEAVRRADGWIVHYAAGRSELAARLPVGSQERIHVIAHGMLDAGAGSGAAEAVAETAEATARAAARARLASRLKTPLAADGAVFLVFGNLRPYKGVEVALRALAQSAGHAGLPGEPSAVGVASAARLIIAGAPWKDFDLAAMQALAAALQITHRVDWLTEFIPDAVVSDLLTAADALLLPYTRFDAMSGVASLGLRARRPTIVSRMGGLPEMVPPAARDRLVVPPNDPAALARAMTAVLTDSALVAAAARPPAAFLAQFEWPVIAEQTRRLYRSLLPGLT